METEGRVLTGRGRSAQWLALPALLLALLVPARAIALCCFDVTGSQAPAEQHSPHGSMPHHGSDEQEPVPVDPALASLATSGCYVPTTPALRERGCSSDPAPPAGDPPPASAPGVDCPPAPDRSVPPRLTLASLPGPVEKHPLRL